MTGRKPTLKEIAVLAQEVAEADREVEEALDKHKIESQAKGKAEVRTLASRYQRRQAALKALREAFPPKRAVTKR